MSDKIISHTVRYPHARTSTIQYLVRREEMTERLRAETERYQKESLKKASDKPRWSLLAWIWGR